MAEIPTTLHEVWETAKQTQKALAEEMTEAGVPFFQALPISWAVSSATLLGALAFMSLMGALNTVIVPTVIAMIQAISQVRKDGAPELAKVAGAIMGEFLGFEVAEDALTGGVGVDANIARAKTLGSALHDLLTKEFGGEGAVTPESGAAAARVFSGYNMNFAAQNAVISTLFDALSVHEFENIRELGVEVAENLGLGRLHRQAMRPLIDNLIVKPYDRYMKQRYRQDSLNAQQNVQAFLSGHISDEQLRIALAQLGYADTLIDILIEQNTPHLTEREALALVTVGKLSQDQAVTALTKNGWSREFAQQKMDAIAALDLIGRERQLANEIVALTKQRYMTPEDATVSLRKLHLSEDDQQLYRDEYGTYLEHQYKHFTLSEILFMLERNLITQSDVDDWARSVGHSEQQIMLLSLFFAEKDLEYEEAVQKKKDAAAKKKKATPPPPSRS
jgi:hypothetical protein